MINSTNDEDGNTRVAKSLQKKAEVTRHMHYHITSRLKAKVDFISALTILMSLLIAIVALSGPDTPFLQNQEDAFYSQMIAVSGFAVLVLSIWPRLRGYEQAYSAHKNSAVLLTDFIRLAQKIRHVDLAGGDRTRGAEVVDQLRQSYSQLTHSLPLLVMSDEKFLKLKQSLLLKIEASSILDEDPETDIDTYLQKIRKLRRRH